MTTFDGDDPACPEPRCAPTSKTSLFVRDLTEKLQRSYPVSLQRGAISINDATGDVDVIREYCASTQESIEIAVASFREVWELGFKAAAAIRPDETDGYSQAYADQMRTALLRIGQEIAVEEVDPDDCRESIKRLVYEALMPPRSAVEPARELSASESASFAKTLARSPLRVEPECQHDLLKPKTTIVVDPNDSFHASCSACKHDFRTRAPLETSSDGWKCVTCGHENPRGALRCQNSRWCTALSYSPENGGEKHGS